MTMTTECPGVGDLTEAEQRDLNDAIRADRLRYGLTPEPVGNEESARLHMAAAEALRAGDERAYAKCLAPVLGELMSGHRAMALRTSILAKRTAAKTQPAPPGKAAKPETCSAGDIVIPALRHQRDATDLLEEAERQVELEEQDDATATIREVRDRIEASRRLLVYLTHGAGGDAPIPFTDGRS
jgi:hypothetical protein